MPYQHNLPPTNASVEALFRSEHADSHSTWQVTDEEIARVALGVEIGKTTLGGLSTRLRCGIIAVAYAPGDPEQLTVVRRKIDQFGEPIRQHGPAQRTGRAVFSPYIGEWRTHYESYSTSSLGSLSIQEIFSSVNAIATGTTHDPRTSDNALELLHMSRNHGGETGVAVIDQAIAEVTNIPLRPAV